MGGLNEILIPIIINVSGRINAGNIDMARIVGRSAKGILSSLEYDIVDNPLLRAIGTAYEIIPSEFRFEYNPQDNTFRHTLPLTVRIETDAALNQNAIVLSIRAMADHMKGYLGTTPYYKSRADPRFLSDPEYVVTVPQEGGRRKRRATRRMRLSRKTRKSRK